MQYKNCHTYLLTFLLSGFGLGLEDH